MVFKFLGLGKKSEFFMEAEPQSTNGSEPAKTEAKTESTKTKPVKTEAVKTEPAKAEPAKAEATPVVTEAPAPAAAKAKATKGKKEKAKSEEVAPVVASQPEAPAATGFATTYSVPSNTPRRRPGPSLDIYKDMARNMNNNNSK